jgi:hypothetical protein
MGKLLEHIDSPGDLKGLRKDQLDHLAAEIREEIIKTVSRRGGHLASNLGVVELTIALHYVFNSPAVFPRERRALMTGSIRAIAAHLFPRVWEWRWQGLSKASIRGLSP